VFVGGIGKELKTGAENLVGDRCADLLRDNSVALPAKRTVAAILTIRI